MHGDSVEQAEAQVPSTHTASPQQGSPPPHDPFASMQAGCRHTPFVASHVSPEQHDAPSVQDCPATAHAAGSPLVASLQALSRRDTTSTSGRIVSQFRRVIGSPRIRNSMAHSSR
jgi:hypothetical protein